MDGATPFQAFTKVIAPAGRARHVHDRDPRVHLLLERLPLRHLADLDDPGPHGAGRHRVLHRQLASSSRRSARSRPPRSSSPSPSSCSSCSSSDASSPASRPAPSRVQGASMADIVLDHVTKRYPDGARGRGRRQPRHRRRRVRDPGRAVGLREVDDAQHDRRPGGHLRGRAAHRRQARQQHGAEGPRHRHGVPELRPLPAHDGAREHGVRPQAGQDPQGRHRPEGGRGGPHPRPHAAPRPQAGQPLGRPAPAGGDGPRASCATRRPS